MEHFSDYRSDPSLLEEIDNASERAMQFSALADYSNPLHHAEAVELHRYVLRIIGNAYSFIRIKGPNIQLERELKTLFIAHQHCLNTHRELFIPIKPVE